MPALNVEKIIILATFSIRDLSIVGARREA
jgi:hypothetical protein